MMPAHHSHCLRRYRWWIAALALCAVLVAVGPHAVDRFLLKRFSVVREGVLYRMGQPTQNGLAHVVRDRRIKTVLLVRTDDAQLRGGVLDWGARSGRRESEIVAEANAQLLHMPFPGAHYWPWPAPDHLEQLLSILADPSYRPILVHCVGGQHRTGTVVALYRMEVERWTASDAIREMYSFGFGDPCPVHDLNLRTFWPRPRPTAAQWQVLAADLAPLAPGAADYDALVRQLAAPGVAPRAGLLVDYVLRDRPFALELAHRVLLERSRQASLSSPPDDGLKRAACHLALECLQRLVKQPAPDRPASRLEPAAKDADTLAAAAAVLADFGESAEQLALLSAIRKSCQGGHFPSYPLLLGVSNRYAANRLAFLRPFCDDLRELPLTQHAMPAGGAPRDGRDGPLRYRYADVVTARLTSVLNILLVQGNAPEDWEAARQLAIKWFDDHPAAHMAQRFSGLPTHHVAREDDDEPPLRR